MAELIDLGQLATPEAIEAAVTSTGLDATAAEVARDEAETAAAAAQAVGTTNDTVIAGRINDPASATATALNATIAAAVADIDGKPSFDERLLPPATADVPVVTLLNASTIVSGATFTPTRNSGVPTYDFDPAFRYNGTPDVVAHNTNYITCAAAPGGASWRMHPETVLSRGVDKFELKVQASGATNGAATEVGVRIVVDGRWDTVVLHRFAAVIGTDYIIHVEFPTARSRHVRVELSSADRFGGMIVPAGQTCTTPGDWKSTGLVIGDSFVGGANTPPDGASRIETASHLLGFVCGFDRWLNLGIGGTGWVNSSTPFAGRIAGAIDVAPDAVFVLGSRNDAADGDGVYAAALPGLAILAAAVPAVIASGPAQAPYAIVNTAVKNAAIEAGVRFVDTLGVITGADVPSSDPVHPTQVGHVKLARAYWAGIDYAWLTRQIESRTRVAVDTLLTISPPSLQEQGAAVALTARVEPEMLGIVDFYDQTRRIGQAQLVAGEATLTKSDLALGAHTFIAKSRPANPRRFIGSVAPSVGYLVTPPALSDILLADLLYEFDARNLTGLTDGAAIATYTPDRGAHLDALTQATTANRPVYVANDTNGHPSMKRTGSQSLPSTPWASGGTVAGTPLTFYVVHRIPVFGTSGQQYLFRGGSPGTLVAYSHVFGGGQYGTFTVAAGTPSPQQPIVSDWQVTCVQFAGGKARVWQNRIDEPADVTISTSNISLAALAIGAIAGGTNGYETHISHVLAYGAQHSDDNRVAMMQFLSGDWDVDLAA